MSTTTTITRADACVLLASGGTHEGLPETGFGLVLPGLAAAAIVVAGVALVIVARRRGAGRKGQGREFNRLVLVTAAVALTMSTLGDMSAAPASAAVQPVTSCELIDYVVTRDSDDTLLGPDPIRLETATVTNITDGTLDLSFGADVKVDVEGLGDHVRMTGDCTCSAAPLIDATIGGGVRAGTSVRVSSGQSVTVRVRAQTTASISNSFQDAALTYALVAYATEVRS